MSEVETNKRVVVDYYQTAFAGDPEKAVADHFGDRYIQHNPDAANGPEAFIGYVKWLRSEHPSCASRSSALSLRATWWQLIPISSWSPANQVVHSQISSDWTMAKS
jgi:hypothetical protein